MGKYGGLKGVYNYKRKADALSAKKAARKAGGKVKLTGSRGYWELVVK